MPDVSLVQHTVIVINNLKQINRYSKKLRSYTVYIYVQSLNVVLSKTTKGLVIARK